MEVYLGNPGDKLTAWCKAHYGKPGPKDPSEGGVWNMHLNDDWKSVLNVSSNTLKVTPRFPGAENNWYIENINPDGGDIEIYYDMGTWQVRVKGSNSNPDMYWSAFMIGVMTDTAITCTGDLDGITLTWSPE